MVLREKSGLYHTQSITKLGDKIIPVIDEIEAQIFQNVINKVVGICRVARYNFSYINAIT